MGIKLLKERFGIKHIIQIVDGEICIGSDYLYNIITIKKGFTLEVCRSGISNDLLERNFTDLSVALESGELKKIVEEPDTYENLITVWTSRHGKVVKKQCEVFEWPEVTTDGEMIYENTFFKTRREALRYCRRDGSNYLKNMLVNRFMDTVTKMIETLKYTFRAVVYFVRAYLFFGY